MSQPYPIRLALFFGGVSSEHEVSCVSAAAWLRALALPPCANKYEVTAVGITKDGRWLRYGGPAARVEDGSWQTDTEALTPCVLSPDRADRGLLIRQGDGYAVQPVDVCVPVLHGKNGEDGTIQGLFTLAGLPFVGAGVLASAACMDKAVANTLMDAAGVPHCAWRAATRAETEADAAGVCAGVEAALPYPVFVKPANAGSSVGISKAKDRAGLMAAIRTALAEDDKVIFEEFVDGQEVECAAIGNPDAPETVFATRPGEILAGAEFYTYDDKYKNGVSQVVIPAQLSEQKLDEVQALAKKAYLALGCCGLTRCDFFVERGTGRVLCNELNTFPGFTAISMYPKLMEHEGLSFSALADRLIELALHKRKGAY
ncbi:MAG TPA: D-alanine--D-alanine ligase [Candidatus Gemmiger avicola]|uniref:D-alanine--D-alanine ligase n=1 Tax=Candidatus Gemmiger avicola TaxID=2838605 RepID=A0A9D2M589_9FIRM|nr:D-alanine--D-alanine ligase [Candidatus Gemmiger avicola]